MIRFFSALLLTLTLSAGASGAFAQGQGDDNRSDSGTQNSQSGQAQGGANASSDPGNSASAPGQQAQPNSSGQGAAQHNGPGAAQHNGSDHGANTSGPYDPSGVGEPSGNGKSDSNSGKRPCAGCVGSADTKNPPGQLPGGHDANRGYECDSNEGVGQTNPAHSGCRGQGDGVSDGDGQQPGRDSVEAQPPQTQPTTQPAPTGPTPEAERRGGVLEQAAAPEGEPVTERGEGPEVNPIGRLGARQLAFTGLALAWMLFVGAVLTAIGGTMRNRTEPRQKELTPLA